MIGPRCPDCMGRNTKLSADGLSIGCWDCLNVWTRRWQPEYPDDVKGWLQEFKDMEELESYVDKLEGVQP